MKKARRKKAGMTDVGIATHPEGTYSYWSLYASGGVKEHRIYVGRRDEVLLSVTIINPIPPGTAKIEIAVNNAVIPDGIMEKTSGPVSRTWKLRDVTTIDIRAGQDYYMSGHYEISVRL